KFRAFRLLNGLEALIISDIYSEPHSSQDKKAACSLYVDVGYFSDTPEFPGTSFTLGHMLFQKPVEFSQQVDTTLEDYIIDHNGNINIEGGYEYTQLSFDIEQDYFFEALYIFSRLFVDDIMSKDVFKQKQDVIKNKFQVLFGKSKYDQLLSSFARTGHPTNKFSEDRLKELRNNIDYDRLYDVLTKFKERHYSAHRMKLVIRSGFRMKRMVNKIKACFDGIPNNRMPPDDFSQFENDLPFDTPAFQNMYTIRDDTEQLARVLVTWALPSFSDFYTCNSYLYIPWIIGYKGKGSLISYLRQKMWSPTPYDNIIKLFDNNDMYYCEVQQNSLYSLIRISIALTSEGRNHVKYIVDTIFSFINLLKRVCPHEAIYNDIYGSDRNIFRFSNYDKEPISFVKQLCKNMHFYPPEAYLTGDKLNSNYNAEVIQKCLNYLAPEKPNIMIFAKDFNGCKLNKVEPWWQMAYTDIQIKKRWIEIWKVIEPLPEFVLPLPNTYLTNDFNLIKTPKEQTEKYPIKLYFNTVSEIWYRHDSKFRLPECCMHFYFISPLKLQSLNNGVLMRLYCSLLKQLLTEELYPALLAGFKYNIRVLLNGFTVKMSGPSATLPLLAISFAQVMERYSSYVITKDIYESLKIQQMQTWYHSVSKPEISIGDMTLSKLKLVHHSHIDMHTTVQGITLKDFQDFVKSFTESLYIKCFVQGNMTPRDAIETVQKFTKAINCNPLTPNTIRQLRGTQIPLGISCYKIKNINKLDTTSVIRNYYQAGVITIELSTLISLIGIIMDHNLYEGLPVNKFTNATVDVGAYDGMVGFSITVCTQAHKYTPEYVDKKIDEFLRKFKDDLEKFTEEELNVYKNMFLKSRLYDNANIEDESNWNEILNNTYIFNIYEQEIRILEDISVKKLWEWFADHTSNGTNFRKLSLHVVGNIPKRVKYAGLEYIYDDHQ
ncbi:Nardilysin, partial [Trachymyrmex cornetzi]